MSYEHLYQGRRRPAPAPEPTPQPNGISMVDHFRRLGKLPIDARAGNGFSEAEHARAQEIRFAMSEGRWFPGNHIPHRLMPLVYPGGVPESFQQGRQAVAGSTIAASFDTTGGGDVVSRLARKIDASMSMSSPLATDREHPRNLATDQLGRPRNDIAPDHAELRRPTMSYKLSQVMGDYQLLDEDSFDESMQAWGVTEPRDRIGLKTEAMALGLMQPRGTSMAKRMAQVKRLAQAEPTPRRYIPAPHLNDPSLPHFVHKDSPAAQKSTAGRPDTPGKKWGLTMSASSDGYAPENTSFWI